MATAFGSSVDMGRLPTRMAQVIGISTAAFITGKTFSQSFSTTPALLQAPAPLLTRQWKKMFDSDKLVGPAGVILSSSAFIYLANFTHATRRSVRLHIATGLLLLLTIPYSYLLLEPINQKLEDKAVEFADVSITDVDGEVGVKQEETVHFLVDRWATVNLGRAILTGTAALLAAWTATSQ